MTCKSIGLIATAALLGAVNDASATTVILPPVSYGGSNTISFWDGTRYGNSLVFNSGPSQTLAGAGITTAVARNFSAVVPLPAVSAAADVSGPADSATATAIADITLTYYLEVVGPSGSVPLDISAMGKVIAVSNGSSNGSGIANFSTCIPGVNISGGSWLLDTTATVTANNPYCVEIEAMASAFEDSVLNTTEDVTATVDPQFTIDPSFLLAPDYTLVFSPGVGAGVVTAAPEPTVSLAAIAALGFLAWSGARRRKYRPS